MTSTTTSRRNAAPVPPLDASPDPLATGRLVAAHARWNDYLGSAAADDAHAMLDRRSLYEIAGLERERWTIVGIELSVGDVSEEVVLYAVDRLTKPASTEDVDEMAVTAFHLDPSTRVDEFIRESFDRVNLRLMSTLAVDRYLRVDDHIQLPRSGA